MQHTSAIINGLSAEAAALSKLNHQPLKGQLRELLANRLLSKLLTIQYGIGSGIIVNQLGMQSPQTDIVIYDRRILPPFIEEQKIGLYPAECVLATIEVKSRVTRATIQKYAKEARKLYEQIYNPECSHYRDYHILRPFCCLFGFDGTNVCNRAEDAQVYEWMVNNAKPLFGVCVLNKFSWLHVTQQQGALTRARDGNEETKAFIAPLLDNIRTYAQRRYSHFTGGNDFQEIGPEGKRNYFKGHTDWFSIYTRNQNWREGEF